MASIRARSGKLFFDFTYQGIRCREQTLLIDNRQNRAKLNSILTTIEAEIRLNRFVFKSYFPSSSKCGAFLEYDLKVEQYISETTAPLTTQILSNIPLGWVKSRRSLWYLTPKM